MATEEVVATHVAPEDAQSTGDVHDEDPVQHLRGVPALRRTLHRGQRAGKDCCPDAKTSDHQTDPSHC